VTAHRSTERCNPESHQCVSPSSLHKLINCEVFGLKHTATSKARADTPAQARFWICKLALFEARVAGVEL